MPHITLAITSSKCNKHKSTIKNGLCKERKEGLDQANQSIDVNKQLQSTGTLITTFQKQVEEENSYVWFRYVPHIFSAITPKDKLF